MAEIVEFPDCCAFIIVNKFKGGHPGSDPEACITPEALDKYLTKKEQEFYGKRAGLVATLSEVQNNQIGHVFLDRRWKVLCDGVHNPRTGSRIWMYFRDLNPTKAREKRIFGE